MTGDPEIPWDVLEDYKVYGIGHFSELWTPDGKPAGCHAQAWTASMLVRYVVEFLLGFKANAFTKTISFNPELKEDIGLSIKLWDDFVVSPKGVENRTIEKLADDFYLFFKESEDYQPRKSFLVDYLKSHFPDADIDKS